MRLRSFVPVVLMLMLLAALAGPAAAQNYRFRVPKVRVVLTVKKDASVVVEYEMEFENEPGAHPIDVVDVGMPKKNYKVLGARINGQAVQRWGPSKYIAIGPEVHLGPHAIQPGQRGTFEFKAQVRDMVYEDTTDEKLASLQFSPTWFGSEYVVGQTNLLLVVKFPEGVSPEDVVWHDDDKPFMQKGILDPGGEPFVSWQDTYRFTGPNKFGCSFPRDVMDNVVEMSMWKLLAEWWLASRNVQIVSGFLYLTAFSVFFMLITRGTGWVLLLILDAGIIFVFVTHPILHLWAWLFIPAWAAIWYFGFHRRKKKYFPAIASVEGGQIRRGLTAPEAAVLLEMPLDRVLSMVIFGMLRKEIVTIVNEDPFTVKAEGEQDAKSENIIRLNGDRAVKIQLYEILFWKRLKERERPVGKINFDKEIKGLITLVRSKVTGFDIERTKEYYERIVRRAWIKVQKEVDVERKNDLADRHFGWLYMADDAPRRWDHEYRRGWGYHPRWWVIGGRGSGRMHATGGGDFKAPAPAPGTGPSFKDVASSFTGRMEKAASGCVSAVDGFEGRTGLHGAGIDLSGVDRMTMDTLESLAESGGRGGGGFGGGCACAGCACACACAGGGR